ncbi:MAG: iron permease [Actinomycetota bacterium]
MGAAFLITLREGLEISLVLAILVGYLVKTGRRDQVQSVWLGTAVAAAMCAVSGVAVHAATKGLEGKAEQAVEGVLALAAAIVLTWMILWMHKNSKSMGGELRAKVDGAATATAVSFIAFVAVAREGFETVLFLLGAETSNASGAQVVIGGLIGLAVSALVGVAIYRMGSKVNLRTFFRATGVLLIVFAAGLVGKAVHEFRELFGFESGWLIDPMWSVTSGPLRADGGAFYDFMKGLFGWSADPERIRVFAYVAYLVPVLVLFLRPDRSTAAASSNVRQGIPTAA